MRPEIDTPLVGKMSTREAHYVNKGISGGGGRAPSSRFDPLPNEPLDLHPGCPSQDDFDHEFMAEEWDREQAANAIKRGHAAPARAVNVRGHTHGLWMPPVAESFNSAMGGFGDKSVNVTKGVQAGGCVERSLGYAVPANARGQGVLVPGRQTAKPHCKGWSDIPHVANGDNFWPTGGGYNTSCYKGGESSVMIGKKPSVKVGPKAPLEKRVDLSSVTQDLCTWDTLVRRHGPRKAAKLWADAENYGR